MMKLAKLFILLCVAGAAMAQKKFDEYAADGDAYQIQITIDRDSYYLWINSYSMDDAIAKCGFLVSREKHEAFLQSLEKAKQKFIEWSRVAKENSVEDGVSKEMDIVVNSEAFFMYGSKWCFDLRVKMKFKFMITKGLHSLVVFSDELVSTRNEFMKSDGVAIFFSSPEEIDSFMKKISIEKVNEYVLKPKAEDLFKN